MEHLLVTEAVGEQERFVTTGCSNLDAILKGGIPCRGITQFYGAAGTGKTQLALQLCLTVQSPVTVGGLEAEALFPSRRLQQLIENSEIAKTYSVNGDVIFVDHISTIDELEYCLYHKVPALMKARKIGLLIIDSIAAPYRVEDWEDPLRGKSLRKVGRQLHELGKNGDLCVICINQVSAIINSNIISDYVDEQPALGLTWLSMITSSIRFYRRNSTRYACIMLASHLPRITFNFEVNRSGVKAIK
ncbi:DNA repair protein XRCC3-like isoform X2 [Odontomachus brunneus]|uniref:DNA repair protein XRCC3-like isoform X2 n=1 Tax=Odontomachus brunneus TaxID=486640 RepID=UPI0013F1C850|nr:DNA repair protein XRCC3-like isoform X2 [Odontomachus brunneus]